MSPLEKQIVSKLKSQLDMSVRFQCSACSIAKPRAECSGVYLWKPRSKMMARAAGANAAAYVICEECARLPDEETYPKIEAALAKRKLFG